MRDLLRRIQNLGCRYMCEMTYAVVALRLRELAELRLSHVGKIDFGRSVLEGKIANCVSLHNNKIILLLRQLDWLQEADTAVGDDSAMRPHNHLDADSKA